MIHNLLKNPLIKIVGILLVLYFGLFANKENPNSLGNRVTTDKIKENISEAWQKKQFITENITAAKQALKESENTAQDLKSREIEVKDISLGIGEIIASCEDSAIISYVISDDDNRKLYSLDKEYFVIGTRKNWLIEKNIIGMKAQGVKAIRVPNTLPTSDLTLLNLFKSNKTSLTYQITLIELRNPTIKTGTSCE